MVRVALGRRPSMVSSCLAQDQVWLVSTSSKMVKVSMAGPIECKEMGTAVAFCCDVWVWHGAWSGTHCWFWRLWGWSRGPGGGLLPETAEDLRPLLWPKHQAILLCRKAKRAELGVGDKRVGWEKEEMVPYLTEAQAEKDQVRNGLDQDGSLPNDQLMTAT